MGQSPTRYTWTYSEYARLPNDGKRYEVLDGEVLVTPAATPRHQHVVGRLYRVLVAHAEAHSLGEVLFDVDVLFAPGQYLRPDLTFVPADRSGGISDRGIEVPPGLIVEVLSPSSGAIDRVKKPRRYGDFGVPEYWVVDSEERVVWVWDFASGETESKRVADELVWQPTAAAPGLIIDVQALFTPL